MRRSAVPTRGRPGRRDLRSPRPRRRSCRICRPRCCPNRVAIALYGRRCRFVLALCSRCGAPAAALVAAVPADQRRASSSSTPTSSSSRCSSSRCARLAAVAVVPQDLRARCRWSLTRRWRPLAHRALLLCLLRPSRGGRRFWPPRPSIEDVTGAQSLRRRLSAWGNVADGARPSLALAGLWTARRRVVGGPGAVAVHPVALRRDLRCPVAATALAWSRSCSSFPVVYLRRRSPRSTTRSKVRSPDRRLADPIGPRRRRPSRPSSA